jgi:hypothetical protein
MTLEIQVLDWDRHKKYDGGKRVNGIPTLLSDITGSTLLSDNWINPPL